MLQARDKAPASPASGPGDDTVCETSCDAFLDGRVSAHQPVDGPRAAIDALFLAAAVPAADGKGEQVLEAGLGAGIASLALAARVSDVCVTGVEVQPRLCALASRNIALNSLEERIAVVEADLTSPAGRLSAAGLEPGSFAHVAANPPFLTHGHTRVSPDESIATAHVADEGALEKWIRFLARMAARRASLTLIHRADALDRLLGILNGRFGGLTVFPLYPREGVFASRIIIQGIKASRAPVRFARGLVLHGVDGGYTRAANAVLRDGKALEIAPDK